MIDGSLYDGDQDDWLELVTVMRWPINGGMVW